MQVWGARRYRLAVTARALVASLVFALAACATGDPDPTATSSEPTTSQALPSFDAVTTGRVIEVLDGDSVRLDVDGREDVELRLIGINTPERDECGGDAAREALEPIEGADVTFSWQDIDQFDRVLGYVDHAGSDVALAHLRAGRAIALSVDHPRLASYAEAERVARQAGNGLWGDPAAACGERATTPISIIGIESDPPGRDEDDLGGEVVALRSDSADPTDLTGWSLRDESTRWRFSFPNGYAIPAGAEIAVVTGCGTDTESTLHWCADDPVWSNDGDTALLLDPNGNIVDAFVYGIKTNV